MDCAFSFYSHRETPSIENKTLTLRSCVGLTPFKRVMKMRFLGRTCLIVLSLLPAVSTQDAWRVVGSDQPVIAEPGDDVILPCHISPRLSAVDMEVRWFRDAFENPVHLYNFQENLLETQDRAYQDRTALSPPALERGDISLRLRNLRPSDRGIYTCYAHDGSQYEEGQTEVIVAALGTQPSISMDSTQGEQTRLVCRSEGSKTPKPDWESKLHISSDFFPGVSGWMVAFLLTLALSIGAIPLLVIQWRRMDPWRESLSLWVSKALNEEMLKTHSRFLQQYLKLPHP
ncbi:butyrophilin-like protein 2 [Acipenser oxyrinchus oxyrinchus]|uniref:Butyrophilin-like protein 2 n=1 Tax=Acipenser oxyrinchus oxyrinchus TaxID=40147 RepID=A0AAD8FT43_ACIOX|nr:butyrophilin-like protein 2 [Acipenser oxyrinchus oxyrinchus]